MNYKNCEQPADEDFQIPNLTAANRSKIESTQARKLFFKIPALKRSFTWNFLIADVAQPILGSDFLAAHNLLPDCEHNRLINLPENVTVNSVLAEPVQTKINGNHNAVRSFRLSFHAVWSA